MVNLVVVVVMVDLVVVVVMVDLVVVMVVMVDLVVVVVAVEGLQAMVVVIQVEVVADHHPSWAKQSYQSDLIHCRRAHHRPKSKRHPGRAQLYG